MIYSFSGIGCSSLFKAAGNAAIGAVKGCFSRCGRSRDKASKDEPFNRKEYEAILVDAYWALGTRVKEVSAKPSPWFWQTEKKASHAQKLRDLTAERDRFRELSPKDPNPQNTVSLQEARFILARCRYEHLEDTVQKTRTLVGYHFGNILKWGRTSDKDRSALREKVELEEEMLVKARQYLQEVTTAVKGSTFTSTLEENKPKLLEFFAGTPFAQKCQELTEWPSDVAIALVNGALQIKCTRQRRFDSTRVLTPQEHARFNQDTSLKTLHDLDGWLTNRSAGAAPVAGGQNHRTSELTRFSTIGDRVFKLLTSHLIQSGTTITLKRPEANTLAIEGGLPRGAPNKATFLTGQHSNFVKVSTVIGTRFYAADDIWDLFGMFT